MMNILIIFLGLLFTAFFAGTETAFVSRLYRKSSGLSEWWRQRPERLISTTLVGTNIAIVTATSIATEIAVENMGNFGEIYVTIGISIIALIFCETLPKSAGLRFSGKWTKAASPILWIFHIITFPVIAITTAFSRCVTLLLEKTGADDTPHPVELMELLRSPLKGLDTGRLLTILIFLRFAGRRLLDIMIPMTHTGEVKVGEKSYEAHDMLKKGIPYIVVSDSENRILGVLDSDMTASISPDEPISIRHLSTLFVPETKDAAEFLRETGETGFPPALVVDEHGETTGIVGGGPLVEKMLRTKQTARRSLDIPGTSMTLRADTPIEQIELMAGLTFPRGQYRTIGGFVEEMMHCIPQKDDELLWESFSIRILSADKRRILRLRITRLE